MLLQSGAVVLRKLLVSRSGGGVACGGKSEESARRGNREACGYPNTLLEIAIPQERDIDGCKTVPRQSAAEGIKMTKQIFSAEDMQRRFERLKAEGKVPPLDYLLDVVNRVANTPRPMTPSDRKLLRTMGVKP